MHDEWYRSVYRRNVVDMHITDIDGRFMGQFDAKQRKAVHADDTTGNFDDQLRCQSHDL